MLCVGTSFRKDRRALGGVWLAIRAHGSDDIWPKAPEIPSVVFHHKIQHVGLSGGVYTRFREVRGSKIFMGFSFFWAKENPTHGGRGAWGVAPSELP